MGRFVASMLAALVAFVWGAPQAGLNSLFTPPRWGLTKAAAQTAVANTITITNRSGAVITNHPFQFGRPFIAGAIPDEPGVLIDGKSVITQADVKNRYPDGSVKFAVIAVMIPTIPAIGSVTLTFRDRHSSHNKPLTQSQMMAMLPVGTATMTLTPVSGPAGTADAGQLLADGNCNPWTAGPIAQTMECADDSASARYDIGFDGTHHPFRPRFYATFWPSLGKVQIRMVGENCKTTELTDLAYSLTLQAGGTIYNLDLTGTQASAYKKIHWTATGWSRSFWLGGAPDPKININMSLPYLASTRFFPNYASVTIPESEIANYYSRFRAYPHEPYDSTWNYPSTGVMWENAMGATGGRNDIGPFPLWHLLWLQSGDWRLREIALGLSDIVISFPTQLRETATGKRLLRTDPPGSNDGLGHTAATTDRKSLIFASYWFVNPSGVKAADKVTVVGTINTNQPYVFDQSHQPDAFYPIYVTTGDPFYLDEMYLWEGANALRGNGQSTTYPSGRGPTGAEGALALQIRGDGWSIRNRAEISFIAPDHDPEKTYFTQLTNEALARWEGGFNVTNGAYYGTGMWNWGRQMGVVNIPAPVLAGTIPTLHTWETMCPAVDGSCAEVHVATKWNQTLAASTMSPWMHYYLIYGLSRAKELGFAAGPIFSYAAQFLTGIVNDSPDPRMSNQYRIANVLIPGVWIQTWEQVYNAFTADYRANDIPALFRQGQQGGGNTYLAAACAAAALSYGEPGGAQAWAWAKVNAYPYVTGGSLGPDPRWPIIPRTDNNMLPAISTQ